MVDRSRSSAVAWSISLPLIWISSMWAKARPISAISPARCLKSKSRRKPPLRPLLVLSCLPEMDILVAIKQVPDTDKVRLDP
ncbi:MAG: hypothetical protein Q8M76_04460, partial [Spirochaetaceae bacterium]|nr:hypothetical protein [Spirochaetaceae bacterium]